MEEDEQEQRRKKVEAGRAKLAHFRQRKTKGDCVHSKKKTAKRKGSSVDAPVQEESPLVAKGGLLGGGDVCESTSCGDTPNGAGAVQLEDPDGERTEDSELPQQALGGDSLEQPGVITKECEQERDPAGAELLSRQEEEAGRQQRAVAELRQLTEMHQPVPPLELEALRLSLSNMHTAQLELTQANLQKEKETALTELREMLNGRHAQELALLQSRQRLELELIREQHAREQEEMALRCAQETAELKEKLQIEMEKNVQMIETLKQDWESERDLCLENLRQELSGKHQSELENLQNQFKKEMAEQKAELEEIFQAKNQAEFSLKTLEAQHEVALRKLHEDLQSEHCQCLEDLELKFKGKEKEKQLELETLQALYEDLKAQSQEEIRSLWSQLESARTNRQEPSELREQPLARGSHVEELEHLRRDFDQQRQRERTEHESELEQLRIYFEKKLRDAEKNYQEDLTLLQQRLREVKEDSPVESVEISSSSALLEEASEKDGKDQLDQFDLQLEQPEVKHNLVEAHQEELKKAKEEIQLMKQEFKERAAEWKVTSEDLKRKAEEKLTLMLLDLRGQAESEKQSIINKFELREIEMRQLQDRQATQIRDLAGSLAEQQGRLRQLEVGFTGDESLQCGQCDQEPGGGLAPTDKDWELAMLRLKEDCALQLTLAQNRFLEERKEIIEKLAAEQDASLRETQEKHTRELQLLQERHQQHVLSLTAELKTQHQAEMDQLRAAFESEQWALSEARVAELQTKHAAEISVLETRHLSNLDSLESCYLSEIQAIRDEHRRALELLRVDLEGQLQKKNSSHQMILTQELGKLKLKHDKELQSAKDSLRIETSAKCVGNLKAPAPELQGAHQGEFECEKKAVLHEKEELHRHEREQAQSFYRKEKESLSLQLQEKNNQILQLKDQIVTLSHEIEQRRSDLEKLQQRRERENQEGANLISMLKADVDLSHSERIALRDALRRLLGLFGETLKAAVALKSRIGERVGLCLEDQSPLDAQPGAQVPSAAPALDETWPGPDAALPELDGTFPECAEMSSVAEISSHVCESFFMSPESTLECEQPVRRIYRSLGLAVDGLLEMALDSSRQLEEARQMHSLFEKEFSCKNEETAQVVRKHQELLERLEEENAARARLVLELHKAEGILEGFKVEKASLQEALGRKEASEQGLVVELESLREQLQWVTQQQAELREENATLWSQKEALATGAEEREAALQKEVEYLTKEQSETRRQFEKDRSALLSQMKVLEAELEEQLSRHRVCAQQAEELSALRQQMGSLDKHLRSQRQFMDEQAVEREQEREDFQQEIQRLEEQLRQVARPQPRGPHDSHRAQLDEEVELLQEKLREKSDGLNELVIKKELADRQVLIQEEEIKRLEETNANTRRQVIQLQEELEKQRKTVKELQQDKEALQEQQMSNLLLVSTLQSKLDEGKCPLPSAGSCPEGPEVQSEAVQRVLLQRETEILDLKEQLEKVKDDLVSKNEEVLHLTLKLDMQNNHSAASVRELQEENANLKAFLHNKEREIKCVSEQLEAQLAGMGTGALSEVMYSRSSEIEELKSIIENLQENQERLQKDKAEEIEQLHEVIEKLQRELSLGGLAVHEVSDCRAEDLQSELERGLLCLQAEGAEAHAALEGELQAALAAKEALSQLLAEQERRHGQALEALQQRLRGAQEAAAGQLVELRHGTARREAEVQRLASQIREFEAALKAKEVKIVERDLEIEAMNKQKSAYSTELQNILSALTRFRRALEQQPLAAADEPPELQRLRVQCARLSRQLQTLNQRFLRCQEALDKPQEHGARLYPRVESPVKDGLQPAKALVTSDHAGLQKRDSVMSVLTVCQRQLESELLLVKNELRLSVEDHGKVSGRAKDREQLLESCQLQKIDLITQVKQLQEKLNCLVRSLSVPDIEAEDSESQQPLAFPRALESSSSDSSKNSEQTDRSPPIDAFNIDKTSCDLIDIIGNQDSLLRNELPKVPVEDKIDLQDGSLCLQASLHSSSRDLTHTEGAEPLKNVLRAMELSSWSSPEVIRKDSTLEPPPSLPLTPCSDALSQRSPDASLRDRISTSLLQADQSGLLCYPVRSAAETAPRWAESLLAIDRAPSADHHVQRTAVEKDVEDFIITSLDSQEKSGSPPLGLEGRSDGSENSDGSGFGEILNQGSERLKTPTAGPPVPPPASRRFRRPLEAMREKEVHPKQVKALLQMVCDESYHILALSEYRGPHCAPLECFPREGQGPLEAVPALRGHPTPAPQKGEKEPADVCLDWRGEFLRVIQEAFEKEREMLKVELQPRVGDSDPRDCSCLLERLEKVVQEQGDLQEKSLEHLRLSDRSSLLSEIQALRAQLRLTHLQNQEKLQQLCTALTSVEARGSQQEHQLRRQVELLAYKVEQEKCIASDLQKTLNEEQEKANDVRKLLVVEQNAVRDLKSELSECKQDNERLLASLNDVQKEVLQLRSVLDSKENDLKAVLQELESERMKERALQSQLEEEQLQHLQREGQSSKTLEELRISLEKQYAQSNRLCVALKHEQTAKDNLQKELQIEYSRCEALLAQERSQLSELQRSLEVEKGRSLELSEALQHERLLTEQLSRRTQEACAHQETQVHHALLRKLKDEKARVVELQAMLEKVQQQAMRSQRQLEAEVHKRCQELQKEKEVSVSLRSTVEALQTPKSQLRCYLEREGEKPAWLQTELEQLHAGVADQEGRKATRRRAETRQSQADAEKWEQRQRDKERLRELELQRQRDGHKITQLQQTVRELEAKEAAHLCPESQRLREQQQDLEKIRQQLLCAAGLLTTFINQTVDRTISNWTTSNEKAVTSLLHTLEELKSELSMSSSSQKKMTAELQIQLVEVLLKDNDSLTKALGAATQEKAELCRAVSHLEKTLKHHLLKGCALRKSDRSAWKQDRTVLQSSPRQPDPGLPTPAASDEAKVCNIKMEKLYLHYLRAESFRKALIYQKKYLLLLIGGFQDSEQETLSMIAHLGVFPSKADKKVTTSRPFTKFRTAVRVVIAIFRLRFLVKKWQEVDRKGALVRGRAPRPVILGEGFLGPQQQQSPPETSESPTRDVSSSHTRDPVPKASPRRRERSNPSPNSRSERSLTASEDPEHSLTEYIHHLEMIQQRLAGVQPDSTSKKSCRQKIKQ
ncbi:pericentrin isoform X32 [Equus przewalskii]|uniref:Pericentrin isoform X32 n=1 Tax=Equus przewalskii TaxID=9798 RepID=A0ABM4MN80_EQUPR